MGKLSRLDEEKKFRRRIRKRLLYWSAGAVIVVLFALLSERSDPLLQQFNAPSVASSPVPSVDQTVYETARALATLAAVPQEQQFAAMALRAADHELDQSFATAIRQSSRGTLAASPVTLAAKQEVEKRRAEVQKDQAQVTRIQDDAGPTPSNDLNEQLHLAQAQLALDNDELENAEDELKRLGGDQQAQLQQAFDQHRSIEAQASSLPHNTLTSSIESAEALSSVRGRIAALISLKERLKKLATATTEARAALARIQQQLAADHSEEERLDGSHPNEESRPSKLDRLTARSETEKVQQDLQRRARDLTHLQSTYKDWNTLLELQHRSVSVALLANGLSAVMSLLGALVLVSVIQYLVLAAERRSHRRLEHYRVLGILIVEMLVLGRLFVLLFGIPKNISTAIGLITAAVTVALRDYIVSFMGWFALMGKRGIRSGDWVEIDGTQGEVAEITTLHTYVMETGNWTTEGHPTGRQAVFLNKYAVERKYFNFSTSEQWLWDELAVPVPAGRAVGAELLDQMSRYVMQTTASSTARAKLSWREFAEKHRLAEMAETPAVVLRTTAPGFEIRARYVTRASDRFQTAVVIRQGLVKLLV